MQIFHTLRFITNHPLTTHHKLDALWRFTAWQIGSRLLPGKTAVKFVNDAKLLIGRGMKGVTGNVYTGLHEFGDMAFILHCLRPEDTFVDVGANVGSYTILAGASIGAKCIAAEPVPSTFAHLMDNIRFNNIQDRADARNIGVGDRDGRLTFTADSDTSNHVLTDTEAGTHTDTITVPIQSLNSLCEGSTPAIIKIDVEGFESRVITGGSDTLAHNDLLAVIMELNGLGARYGYDDKTLHRQMLDFGFNIFTYDPFGRKLTPLAELNEACDNMLYIKDVDRVAKRLREAPCFHILNNDI